MPAPTIFIETAIDPIPEAPLASWEDVLAFHCPYEEIWEKDGQWLMGRQNLPAIIRHWQTNLPRPCPDVRASSVSIEFQYPTVRNEVSPGEQIPIVRFIPPELVGIFEARLRQVAALRWLSWGPEIEALVVDRPPINGISMGRIAGIVQSTENRAIAMGLPELWQIGCAAFGFEPMMFKLPNQV